VSTPASLALRPDDRIRLPSHLGPVRRDDHDIQLGVDVDGAMVLADPDGALTALLDLMDGRYRLRELQVVAEQRALAEDLDRLLETLTAAGLLTTQQSPGPSTHSIRLVGLGPAGRLIGDQLLRAGVGQLVAVDLDGAGWAVWGGADPRVQQVDHWSQPSIDATDLTVVVTDRLEPDRALAVELTRVDHPHLLVRPRAHGAVVGPLVVPGRTSCLRCGDLSRTRSDPAWPRMLAQLCRIRGRWDPLAAEWAAALTTTQVLAHLAGRTVETAAATLELGPLDWSWQRRVWPADPACGCCWVPHAEW
jgi:hypothetical protein